VSADFIGKHRHTLAAAVDACRTRAGWSAYDTGARTGDPDEAAFQEQCGRPFRLDQPGRPRPQTDEVSPYTGSPLGVSYPVAEVGALIEAATSAWPAWRDADTPVRVGAAAAVLGAIQSPRTLDDLAKLSERVRERGRVALEPAGYRHPAHPGARTSGPLLAVIDIADHDLYGEERFGPVAFVIACDDAEQALDRAARDAREGGAITAFAYSTDEEFLDRVESAYAVAGAAVTSHLTGPMPLNFSAAFGDYHVTGLNPAGTATLTDEAFIAGRFRIVQSRRPAAEGGPS
jgi:hypothetical protein